MDATSHPVAAMHQMSPELWDFCLGTLEQELTHTSITVGVFFCRWCGFTFAFNEQQVWPADRKLVRRCFGAKYETSWNHVCVLSHNLVLENQMKTRGEDLTAKTVHLLPEVVTAEDGGASRMFWQERGLCLFMVFIHWYLLSRQTWWHSGLPPGKAVAAMFGASAWLNGGSERDKTAESCQPTDPGLDPLPRGRIRGHSGQKAISNDGWWRLREKRRGYVLEKDKSWTWWVEALTH